MPAQYELSTAQCASLPKGEAFIFFLFSFVILPGAVWDASSKFEESTSKSQHSDMKHPRGKVPPALFVFL